VENKERILNIPNLLSFYRIVAFPVILYFIFNDNDRVFINLLVVNLITDILDGYIARTFNLQTAFGAKLDSLADIGTYILAFIGVFWFKWDVLKVDVIFLYLFLAVYLVAELTPLIRFQKFGSLHLYSSKITAYLQGIFIFVLFYADYYPWLFYTVTLFGVVAYLESIVTFLVIPELESNAKGLYWVMKKRKNKQD
jgi:cardiolipin synthase